MRKKIRKSITTLAMVGVLTIGSGVGNVSALSITDGIGTITINATVATAVTTISAASTQLRVLQVQQ